MTKRIDTITHETVSSYFSWEQVKLKDLAARVEGWIAAYGPEAYLEMESGISYDSPYLTAEIKETREETDEEYAHRQRQEAAAADALIARKEANELAEYKRLQAKFGATK